MTTRSRTTALLACAALFPGLAACGADDTGEPIPRGQARQLDDQLDRAEQQATDGLCDEALDTIDEARATVDGLDDRGVGGDVQDALGDGVDNLRNLAILECEEEEVETTPETTPQPLPPTTTETEPPETDTQPPETETETAPEPEDDDEPDEGNGGAQFDPNNLPPGQQRKLEESDD